MLSNVCRMVFGSLDTLEVGIFGGETGVLTCDVAMAPLMSGPAKPEAGFTGASSAS